MAAVLTQSLGFDDLPGPLKDKALEMLLKDVSTRKVSALLAKHGYKLSHNAIARYKRVRVIPAIQASELVQQAQHITSVTAGSRAVTPADQTELTKALATAQPVLSRVDWMWDEVVGGVVESKGYWAEDEISKQRKFVPSDLNGRAKLLGVGRNLVETQARALQLPGFVPQAPESNTTLVQIVIGAEQRENPVERADDAHGETIEIAAVRE